VHPSSRNACSKPITRAHAHAYRHTHALSAVTHAHMLQKTHVGCHIAAVHPSSRKACSKQITRAHAHAYRHTQALSALTHAHMLQKHTWDAIWLQCIRQAERHAANHARAWPTVTRRFARSYVCANALARPTGCKTAELHPAITEACRKQSHTPTRRTTTRKHPAALMHAHTHMHARCMTAAVHPSTKLDMQQNTKAHPCACHVHAYRNT
jgi:hypothetical protein